MSRPALLAVALGVLAACTSATTPAVTIGFRQPAALAVFQGLTRDDAAAVRPYVAVANAARNDLTLLDAADDTSVQAPVQLRALVLPVAERPVLLAAASLGDDDPADPLDGADLLVAVSAGDSVVQVVTTWDAGNAVLSEPGAGSPAVDLGDDVVAITAVPSAPGTARVAAALAGGKLAVVGWKRAADGKAIELDGTPAFLTLGFQPLALAAMPDDPDVAGVDTAIYAATLDEVEPGVHGVAEISTDLATVRALDARGPTRLVAAARVRERGPLSTAKDASAFDLGAAPSPRVYAVLDESGCGIQRRIDCGVVTLSPDDGAIPADWAGRMPYRAPIGIPGRPLALAVSPPPVAPPSADPADADWAGDFMRVYSGTIPETTTGVGMVASDDGKVYFLDLGRFKAVTALTTLRAVSATTGAPVAVDTSSETTATLRRRLWIQDPGTGTFVPDLATGATDVTAAASLIGRAPGWTRSSTGGAWTAAWQAVLPDLASRAAEAGDDGSGPWLALQVGYGTPRRLAEVVKVWHPALGVQAGDLAVIRSSDVAGCVPEGTPAEQAAQLDFEVEIGALLPPTDAHPGGALALVRPDGTAHPDWAACFDALQAAIPAGGVLPRLSATIRAGGFVVTSAVGYAGRPTEVAPNSWEYALAYPDAGTDEDTLADPLAGAAACPLVDWDGAYPVAPELTCGGACDRAVCERAVLARKARRVHNNFEDCSTDPDPDWAEACAAAYGAPTSPVFDGPAVSFRFGVQEVDAGAGLDPVRGLALAVTTTGGEAPAFPVVSASTYRASSAIAFDRSPLNAPAGYRFLVSYTGDLVLDVSPQLTPTDVVVLR